VKGVEKVGVQQQLVFQPVDVEGPRAGAWLMLAMTLCLCLASSLGAVQTQDVHWALEEGHDLVEIFV